MKNYRITWFAIVEDDSVLEGRSLVKAETDEKAIEKLIMEKTNEYRLKPNMLRIQSISEMPK